MPWTELDTPQNAGASASGASISVSRTYTGGERAVVWVTVGGATTITVTDGTNTYTQVGSQVVASSGDVQAVFECLSCTAGTFTVQANFGTSNAFRGIAVHRFSGLTGSGSLVGAAQTAPGTGADGLSSGNLTPASQPALLLGVSTDYNGSTVNVGTGFTTSAVYTNVDTANGSYTVSETKRLTSTSAVAATFTATSSPQNFVTLAYWAAEQVTAVTSANVDSRLSKRRNVRGLGSRWTWAGFANEKLTQRGWFSRDIVLPIAAGGGSTPVPLSDSAAGSDSASIAATAAASDTSAGTDSAAIAATASAADSAAGTDAGSVAASVAPTDSSAGADAAAVAAAAGLSDSAAGAEAQSIAATLTASDSASGTETAAIAVTLALADSAAGADGVVVDTGGTPVALADSATGTESASVAADVAGSDAGAGTESTAIAATASASDTAAGSDTIAPAVAVAPTDTSAGTDAAAVAAAAGISDSAAGTESAATAVTLTAADAAAGSDGISVDTGNPDKTFDLTDAAVGTDAIDVQTLGLVLGGRVIRRIPKELRDVGFGMDSISIERIVKPKARRLVDVVVLPQRDLFSDPETLEATDGAIGASRIYVERWVREAPRLIRTPRPALRRSATR